uniref:Synaptobrevin, longin-like domain protein n=1 Tax=Tanacetum cinerariifolium TaxID=118510 RepID=A0A6L2N7L5_TANCI|nr:hypothetical protein [Tanacetum cinerariifolium]
MVVYLTKSNTSKGFNQIINFLHGSSIKYALTVNPNIYVSCIKQFWTIVAVKNVNDVIRLQALVDKKKVVVTEATIREALRLDDAGGVECLPNEEIFAELARMGYKKPSTKLTFYKAFFSSQWKFLIHTILQCMSAKRTSWNEFSSSMASAIICLSSGRKFNFSKYIFDNLVRNVDSPSKFYMYPRFLQLMIRKQVGKGFSGVETPLFEGMLVEQQVAEEGDAEVHGEEVNAGDVAEGDISAANDEAPTVAEEPSIPSPTPPTLPPQPSHVIPSTFQVQPTPPQLPQVQPQSPQPQPQPQQDAGIPMNLLQEVMDTYTALSRRVKHLELDKIVQALEITKLKRRVKKLEKRNKGRMIAKMDQDADVVLKDDKEAVEDAKDETEPAKVQEVVDVVTTAKLITEVVTAASETITAASETITAAEAQVPAVILTAAPVRVTVAPNRRRKGVVIRDPQEESTTSTIIPAKTKSNDKGKRILVEEPKPLKKQQQIKQDAKFARELEAELNKNIDWDEAIDHVKKKAKEDPAVKNIKWITSRECPMMIYVLSLRLSLTQMWLFYKRQKQIEKEENRALKRLNETPAEKAAKKQKLDEEVEDLRRHLQIMPNKDDYVYTEATPLARKFPEFLRNFDREDLEALWSLVKERFADTKPKNFFDDFLLVTLGAMFEKPDIHAQIWKNQRSVHGQAKMQNAVRFEVEEESEVSLELLSFGVDAAKELKKNMLSV